MNTLEQAIKRNRARVARQTRKAERERSRLLQAAADEWRRQDFIKHRNLAAGIMVTAWHHWEAGNIERSVNCLFDSWEHCIEAAALAD